MYKLLLLLLLLSSSSVYLFVIFLFNRARTHLNQITKSFILYCGGGWFFFFIRKVCFLVPLLLIHSFIYFISSLIWLFQFHYIKCSLFFLYLCVYSGGDLMRWGCVFFIYITGEWDIFNVCINIWMDEWMNTEIFFTSFLLLFKCVVSFQFPR